MWTRACYYVTLISKTRMTQSSKAESKKRRTNKRHQYSATWSRFFWHRVFISLTSPDFSPRDGNAYHYFFTTGRKYSPIFNSQQNVSGFRGFWSMHESLDFADFNFSFAFPSTRSPGYFRAEDIFRQAFGNWVQFCLTCQIQLAIKSVFMDFIVRSQDEKQSLNYINDILGNEV